MKGRELLFHDKRWNSISYELQAENTLFSVINGHMGKLLQLQIFRPFTTREKSFAKPGKFLVTLSWQRIIITWLWPNSKNKCTFFTQMRNHAKSWNAQGTKSMHEHTDSECASHGVIWERKHLAWHGTDLQKWFCQNNFFWTKERGDFPVHNHFEEEFIYPYCLIETQAAECNELFCNCFTFKEREKHDWTKRKRFQQDCLASKLSECSTFSWKRLHTMPYHPPQLCRFVRIQSLKAICLWKPVPSHVLFNTIHFIFFKVRISYTQAEICWTHALRTLSQQHQQTAEQEDYFLYHHGTKHSIKLHINCPAPLNHSVESEHQEWNINQNSSNVCAPFEEFVCHLIANKDRGNGHSEASNAQG